MSPWRGAIMTLALVAAPSGLEPPVAHTAERPGSGVEMSTTQYLPDRANGMLVGDPASGKVDWGFGGLGDDQTLGDVNGDGIDDIVTASVDADPRGRRHAGSVFVVFGRGPQVGDTRVATLSTEAGFRIDGVDENDGTRLQVDTANVNGDRYDDVIIGMREANPFGRVMAGAVYVVYGSAAPTPVDLADLGSRGRLIAGAETLHEIGSTVAGVGDLNGDGLEEIVVGIPEFHFADAGRVYIVWGSASRSTIDLRSPSSHETSTISGKWYSGYAVSSAGDVNGDGRPDLMIASTREGIGGVIYVVFGRSDLGDVSLATPLGSRGFKITAPTADVNLGTLLDPGVLARGLAPAGDVNGDGFDDVLVGTTDFRAGASSNTYVVLGASVSADVSLAAASPRWAAIKRRNREVWFGSFAGVGDIDGDGYDDLAISDGPLFESRWLEGAVAVIYGRAAFGDLDLSQPLGPRGAWLHTDMPRDTSGKPFSRFPLVARRPGDVNADGKPDLVIGTPDARTDSDAFGQGVAFVVHPTLLDTIPPDGVITAGPEPFLPGIVPRLLQFGFQASEVRGHTRCTIDGRSTGDMACRNGGAVASAPVGLGRHVMTITHIDAAGNEDPTPATREFECTPDLCTLATSDDSTGPPVKPPTKTTALHLRAHGPRTLQRWKARRTQADRDVHKCNRRPANTRRSCRARAAARLALRVRWSTNKPATVVVRLKDARSGRPIRTWTRSSKSELSVEQQVQRRLKPGRYAFAFTATTTQQSARISLSLTVTK